MSTFGYALENVGRALEELTENEGTLKERVGLAAVQLRFAPESDLPSNLKSSLQALFSMVPANGDVADSVAQMTHQDARRFADALVALHGQMWFHSGRVNP